MKNRDDLPSPDQHPEQRMRFPQWMKRSIHQAGQKSDVEALLAKNRLHTVCVSAKCPNRGECFSKGTATFMILGDVCTRNCSFCGVTHGTPESLDPQEPGNILDTVKRLNLSFVVITSVTRDDLADGGAEHFHHTISLLKSEFPKVGIEVLIPDFQGKFEPLMRVLSAHPDVLNHNIETVPRLYPRVRPQARYERSLELLKRASDHGRVTTKSGIMVGLGESVEEVLSTMRDLRSIGCSMLTVGQYLRPSETQLPVERFVSPEEFELYRSEGVKMGFSHVSSGPYVRSSYHASEGFSGI